MGVWEVKMQILKATIKIALPVVCKIENINHLSLADVIINHPDARIGTHFPIGWSGYGTYYLCPNCKKGIKND
jgi:hypothetical protein